MVGKFAAQLIDGLRATVGTSRPVLGVLSLVMMVGIVRPAAAGAIDPEVEAPSVLDAVAQCDASKTPCKPVISGSFGDRMPARPRRPHRTWVVVCKNPSSTSVCDYRTVSEALEALEYNRRSGDSGFRGKLRTIRVQPGTYNMSAEGGTIRLGGDGGLMNGTGAQPYALVAFNANNRPKFVGSCTRSRCTRTPKGYRQSIVVTGNWWLIDGIQVERVDWGVFVDGENVTIQNGRISNIYSFGVNIAHRVHGNVLIEKNVIEEVGNSHLHHGVYASNGQTVKQVYSNDGCGELKTPKIIKSGITIRSNYFREISGSAVQLNASDSGWQDHRGNGLFTGARMPDSGIHGTIIENNVILDTQYGINLYRYAFGTRVVNNTFIATTDGKQRSAGHFLQLRNGAYNVIANNIFYSDISGKVAIVGYKECPKDPPNDLNLINYNLWCMPGNAQFSWNETGNGISADRPLSSLTSRTGQERQGTIATTGTGVCRALNLGTNRYILPDGEQSVVSNKGAQRITSASRNYFDFNDDGKRNGGDERVTVCPVDDFAGRGRTGSGCDIGAHEYDGSGSPPPDQDDDTPPPADEELPFDVPPDALMAIHQEGLDGYSGTSDTHIQENRPDAVFGDDDWAGATGDWPEGTDRDDHILIRFDNLRVPAGKKVASAEIWIYVSVPTSGEGYAVRTIEKRWEQSSATWNKPWDRPGARKDKVDRGSNEIGRIDAAKEGWHRVEIGQDGLDRIQEWIDSPDTNFGFILENGANPDNLIIRTSEYANPAYRPIFVVAYGEGGSPPPDPDPDPPPVVDGDYPVPIPADLPEDAEIYAFQDGFAGYRGTSDSHIQENSPNRNYGAHIWAGAVGDWPQGTDKDDYIIIRWADLDIPVGATVRNAELWFYANVATSAPGFDVYELKTDWNEDAVTWNEPWKTPGAKASSDRGNTHLGTLTATDVGWYRLILGEQGKMVVQRWIDDPSLNNGIIIAGPDNPDDLIIRTSEYSKESRRPVMVVVTSETSEEEPAIDPVANLDFLEFQQGREGYTGASDTYICEADPDNVSGNMSTVVTDGDAPFLSGKDKVGLLKWEQLSVPDGSIVEEADVWVYVADPTGDEGFQLYEMKRPWNEEDATWNVPWTSPGAANAADRGFEVLGTFAPAWSGWHSISLNEKGLEVVQGWIDDPASNAGLMLTNPDNGNALGFISSDFEERDKRPILTIGFRREIDVPDDAVATSAIFQNGLNGYTGAADTQLDQSAPFDTFGDRPFLDADGDAPFLSDKDRIILLRWDMEGIPSDAVIENVQVWAYVFDPTSEPGYFVYGVEKEWDPTTASWRFPWNSPGADGDGDRGKRAIATFGPTEPGWHSFSLSDNGVELVQQWLQDPSTNQGLLITHGKNPNSLKIFSSDNVAASSRPMLVVTYRSSAAPQMAVTDGSETPNAAGLHHMTEAADSGIPTEYMLDQNYPNPFNNRTAIRFGLPEDTEVRLDVFDILGHRVQALVQERLSAGMHTTYLDASALPSGTYFYVFRYGSATITRKMVLLR